MSDLLEHALNPEGKISLMKTKLGRFRLAAAAACLCVANACQAPRQAPVFSAMPTPPPPPPDVSAGLIPEYKDALSKYNHLRVYLDRGNLVLVQKEAGGFESGKYIVPMISSYDPRLGGDGQFSLTPITGNRTFINLGGITGLAEVCDYRKHQSSGPANGSQPLDPKAR